jgi:hypothetical protein
LRVVGTRAASANLSQQPATNCSPKETVMPIELSKEARQEAIASLQKFFKKTWKTTSAISPTATC